MTKTEDSDGGGGVGVEKESDGINSNTNVVVQDGSIAKEVVEDSSKPDAPSDDINDLTKAVDTKPNNNGVPSLNNNSSYNNNNNKMSPPKKKGEEDNSDDDEYNDSDSEYTYETISDEDDEADQPTKKSSKGGWFGFLRGGNKKKQEEEEYSSSGSEDEEEEEEEDIVAAIDNLHSVLKEGEEEIQSSDDEHIKHPLLNDSSSPSTNNINNINSTKDENEEEEALLMAQAISRVQQRIQNNNGNLYEALDEDDKQLVDSLKGVKDEEKIREVVEQSMQKKKVEEKESCEVGEERVTSELVEGVFGGGDGGGTKKLIVDTNNAANNATAIMMEDTPKVTEIIKSHVVQEQTEESLVLDSVPDMKPEVHTEPLLDVEPSIQVDKNEHSESGGEDEDDEDEDDDEQPTLEEQRSLLSLAAEHDRVDVIQELLNDPALHELLLAGVSSSSNNNDLNDDNDTSTDKDENTAVSFVPPPLHAAVAHGSINAASCLLRMGSDPSIRPNVPLPYLSGSYQTNTPSQRSGSSSGSVTMEEDRNYKKYHDMSAWELAFGSTTVIIEDDNNSEGVVAEEKEKEEEEPTKRGWFGFGSSKPKEEEDEEECVIDVVVDGVAKKRRIKRKLPLNIAPSKLEGIKHAFTAEMLRAIGSDEVDRVSQLLNAGMDSSMEVAGKSLVVWAKELDATDCCELFEAGMVDDDEEDEVQREQGDDGNQIGLVDTDKTSEVNTPTLAQQPRVVQDERLAGLSLSDIETLTSENLNLIPALTTCRDNLASEAHICQSILRDVGSGKAGLSSQSLLELVRSLKEQRGRAEEAAAAWQRAWEEREDEVDFFYEEVLDDVMRGELGPVLDAVEPIDPSLQGLSNGVAANNMDDAAKRFIKVDNRVNTLRASIAKLAEESAHFVSEIEHHGMAGALSLTRSLRDEVKEVEKKINLAMMGEGMCRRKIEIIQHRLGHHEDEEGAIPAGEDYADETNVVDDDRMEDYQLQAIVQQQEKQRESGVSGGNSSPLPVKRSEDHTDEQSPGREERDSLVVAAANGIIEENNFMISNALADTVAAEVDEDEEASDDDTNDIIVEDIQDEEIESVAVATQEPRKPVDHLSQTPDESAINGGSETVMSAVEADESPTFAAAEAEQSKSPATTDNKKVDTKPSHAILEGKSTAIVVHSPNNQAGSISSQILEILLRIVGLRRETSRSNSYHDVEGNPHVMIV